MCILHQQTAFLTFGADKIALKYAKYTRLVPKNAYLCAWKR